MEMDLEPGFPPDLWNLQAPHKPEALHQMFVDAGSDIILTNTFGANAPRLKLHNAENDTHAINKAGAEIAGKVAAASDRPVVVAGSVGPTGELFEPMGLMTMDSAREEFKPCPLLRKFKPPAKPPKKLVFLTSSRQALTQLAKL